MRPRRVHRVLVLVVVAAAATVGIYFYTLLNPDGA